MEELKSEITKLMISICKNIDSNTLQDAEEDANKILKLLRDEQEKGDFKGIFVYTNTPNNKIARIKLVRRLYTLGLKEAKDLVDSKGDKEVSLKSYISHSEARSIKVMFGNEVRIVCPNQGNEHQCEFEKEF